MNKKIKRMYASSLKEDMTDLLSKIRKTEACLLELTSEDKIDMAEMEVLTKMKRAYRYARFELEKIYLELKK